MSARQLAADLRVIAALGRRSVRNTFRHPQYLAPIIVFPSLFLAINVGGAGRAVDLAGFPEVHGFLDFQLAAGILQSALLAAVQGGTGLALDIELGFTDRLLAAPISRPAIVLGRLVSTFVLGAIAAAWFIAIGLLFGAEILGGVLGALIVLLLGGLCAASFGALAAALALRSGTASVVQGTFPLVFVILFLSSAFFPAHLMQEPAASAAEYNPLSLIADGIRDPVIHELSGRVALDGFAGVAIVAMLGLVASTLALRGRLRAA